jgi:hypothetical protein
MSDKVTFTILADEYKHEGNTLLKGHPPITTKDSPKLQASALKGLIEYANPMQVGLFD